MPFALIVCLLAFSGTAFAQVAEKEEPAAVLEIGAAPGWNLTDPGSSLGPTVAVEFTPIRNWLEMEIGVTPSFGRHSTEWSTDLLFKKPWDLTPKIEFMAGIGTAWVRSRSLGITTHSLAAEVIGDFMFWTSPNH